MFVWCCMVWVSYAVYPSCVCLSYNIQLSGLDVPGHEWSDRIHPVCTLLKRADIACLQELSGQQCADIQSICDEYGCVAYNLVTGLRMAQTDPSTQEGLSILYKKDTFECCESGVQ